MYQASQPVLDGAGAAGVRKASLEVLFFNFVLGFRLGTEVFLQEPLGAYVRVCDVLAASR